MHEITQSTVVNALSNHIGRANGVTAARLVHEITGQPASEHAMRQLREVVVTLRNEGYHVGAHPSSGYFMCATEEELNMACLFLYDRAMASLTQISAMKRISLPDLKGQLRLPT